MDYVEIGQVVKLKNSSQLMTVEAHDLDGIAYCVYFDDKCNIKRLEIDMDLLEDATNALRELERFQTDRLLHKNTFDLRIATMNIFEELLEAHGVGDNKERKLVSHLYDGIENIARTIKENYDFVEKNGYTYSEPTIEDQIDAFCDIQVFAGGEVGKLGYSNEQCLIEVGKEINSRTGEIVNGKFEKYKTEEAMSKWYKANFSQCKLNVE